MNNSLKVAVVHDWLTSLGGAEYTLKQILELFPQADLFTIVDTLPTGQREWLGNRDIYTSPLQQWPLLAKYYRHFIWRMPYWIEQFDLEAYDLIISDSHAVAKGVIVHPHQKHLAYIYSPMRYAWDLSYEHERIGAFGFGFKKYFLRHWFHRFRIWDAISSTRPHMLVAISHFVQKRIKASWGKDADVIYPPVDIDSCPYVETKEDYYITLSRLVPYKRIDLMLEAFERMPHKRLFIVGDGPMLNKLQNNAPSNVTFTGYLEREEMMNLVSKAKGFLFMPKEDFGIAPLEAQACGTPVIAYGKGGAAETVCDLNHEHPTGVLIHSQASEELVRGIVEFEKNYFRFNPKKCREWSKQFSNERFKEQFIAQVTHLMEDL